MKEFDRVSSVLQPFSGVEFVPEDILATAAEKGIKVHKIIEGIIKGFEEKVDYALEEYIKSFKRFWSFNENAFKDYDLICEKRYFCEEKMISGKPDLVAISDDKVLVFDWKTSQGEHSSWKLQSAAYTYLLQVNDIKNTKPIIFMSLSKYGAPPKLYKYTYEDNICTFFKCLDIYRFFDMKNTRNKWS